MCVGAHGGLMCPLEKGVRRIETGHQMPGRSWRAGKPAAMESPKALIAPLKRGIWGINRASSDAGPELAGREALRRWKARRP